MPDHVRRRAGAAAMLAALATLSLTACTSAAHTSPAGGSAASTTTPTTTTRGTAAASRAEVSAGSTLGKVVTTSISGRSTGFLARPAVVYLPAAARTHPHERFPVLILLHGTEGGPTNWVTYGGARTTLDRFAAAHNGQAPVVVMPDINGSLTDDTECIRTTKGADVERYLLDVVPAWIRTHLPVTRNPRGWGIAGASEGGTCALMLALRGTSTWSFVGDFSGLRRATVGDTDDPTATIAQLFGGSRSAYNANDPTVLLRKHRYPQLSTWFESGASDRAVLVDQKVVAGLARRSVRAVRTATTPGKHHWTVFRASFASALPWFWARS